VAAPGGTDPADAPGKSLPTHAANYVPYYRKRPRHGAVKQGRGFSLAQWRQLPILIREEVQRAGKSLLANKLPAGHGKINQVQASGSTGTPITAFGTDPTQFFWRAATLRDHLWHQLLGHDLVENAEARLGSPPAAVFTRQDTPLSPSDCR
jgi:phenylacetate-coenzyme A ligase PaaK-like adenylate-forming protein